MFGFTSTILAAWTVQAVSAQASIRSVSNTESRHLYERIAGYKPESIVTDHNAIDRDQKFMEVELAKRTDTGYANAKDIYEEGGNSKSYAEITLTNNLTAVIPAKTVVVGTSVSGVVAKGTVYKEAGVNQNKVKILYDVSENQETWVLCRVGALDEGREDSGCFKDTGTVKIGATDYDYSYEVEQANMNGRTLQGFSTAVESKMINCTPGCPFPDAKMFVDYYGQTDYGDRWVQAALSGGATSFSNGNADFKDYGDDGKIEVIKKGTVYLNVFMYVIREFEDAIVDCKTDCDPSKNCNDDPVHAWDEGVAFYSGSLEEDDGAASGYLLHQLADKRCKNFKTCGTNGDLTSGTSYVNHELLRNFETGKEQLLAGECAEGRVTLKTIRKLMYIPLIQGTLRYAYKVDKSDDGEKQKAEGAVFAAAILPLIHNADASAAKIIYDNMSVGASSTSISAVKGALESVYGKLDLTCKKIGGLVDTSSGGDDYYVGAEACEDNKSDDDGATSGSDDKSNDDGATSGSDDKSSDDRATTSSDDKSNDDGALSGSDDKKSNDDGSTSGSDDNSAPISKGVITAVLSSLIIMWNML